MTCSCLCILLLAVALAPAHAHDKKLHRHAGREARAVLSSGDTISSAAVAPALKAIKVHSPRLLRTRVLTDEEGSVNDMCFDDNNGWPVQCAAADEDRLHDCKRARSFCSDVPRASGFEFAWFYQNCLRDACACIRIDHLASAQDPCNAVGNATSLMLKHYSKIVELQTREGPDDRQPYSSFTPRMLDAEDADAVWDSDLPTKLHGQERPCAVFGFGHVITFDRASPLSAVYRDAGFLASNFDHIDSGLVWLVKDPSRLISIQARMCSHYDFDEETLLHGNCTGPAGQLRSLSISGRFLKGHFLHVDHRRGQIHWDGIPILGVVPGKLFQWNFSWPTGCGASVGPGCLISMREGRQATADMILEIALPLGVRLQVQRHMNFLNVIIRMKAIPNGQAGMCCHFFENAAEEFSAIEVGDAIYVADLESTFSLPEVSQEHCLKHPSTNQSDLCIPLDGLVSWYRNSALKRRPGDPLWSSSYGGFVANATHGQPDSGIDGNYISGHKDSSVYFGEILKDSFTVCSISRYNDPRSSMQRDVLQGTNADVHNQFFQGQVNGSIMAAFYGCWVTPTNDMGDIAGYQPDTPVNMGSTDWVAMCGSNRAARVQGWIPGPEATSSSVPLQLANRFANSSFAPACSGKGGQQGLHANKNLNSEWAVAEIITWDRPISDLEMRTALVYLKRVMDTLPPHVHSTGLLRNSEQ